MQDLTFEYNVKEMNPAIYQQWLCRGRHGVVELYRWSGLAVSLGVGYHAAGPRPGIDRAPCELLGHCWAFSGTWLSTRTLLDLRDRPERLNRALAELYWSNLAPQGSEN